MEKINITYAGPGKVPRDLSPQDSSLVASNYISSQFGYERDVIEIHIFSENEEILLSDYDGKDFYPSISNNPNNNTYSDLILDPEKDVKARGFNRGSLTIQYNFFNNLFNSSQSRKYWIKEISRSRTEIRLSSQVLSITDIKGGLDAFNTISRSQNDFFIFYLNFGNNDLVVANNAAIVTSGEFFGDLIIKLYEPLPPQYDLKSQLWIVRKVAESVSYNINIEVEAEVVDTRNLLRGPNYKIELNTKNGQTTPYYSYNSLLVSPVSSSSQKLSSWYQDKAISINVDYSDFNNFVHFSSATERVNNFYYKLQLIESSKNNITSQSAIVGGNSSAIGSSISAEQQIINSIIENFDTYEYFLYFESSSWTWPKRTSTQPYELYSVTSSQATNFLGSNTTIPTATTQSLLWSASYYDSTNKDILRNSIPQYVLDDPDNQPGIIFLDMLGQHFDNVWIYYKDVTNRYNATNNPNTGISIDLVSDALKGLGMNLYTNTNVSDNLYYTLFGINPDGSLLPPTGSEKITEIGGKYVTSSIATLPAQTVQDEIYKRLYHNLPYLYKTKGTLQSIKALISIYGIPESILSVKEFGGNYTGSLNGIFDVNASEYKVQIATGSGGNVTGSQTISSSLLSAYTTIQYPLNRDRLNSNTLEIGFSPSDVVNANISQSQGLINFDQLVGSPAFMYSSSYVSLVSASNSYFSTYTQKNSVWEYMRLLKFYNNSLFKTIKDFVPARSNVSTGIIVKSHLYERNKYARHEPSMSFNEYSQSIDLLDFSADSGGALPESRSTYWNSLVVTPYGLTPYTSSKGVEKYTGEFSGSTIDSYISVPFDQTEISNNQKNTYYPPINLGARYQNITASVKSRYLLDLDYSGNPNKPVNYGAVTYSLSRSLVDSYSTYTNNNNPFAEVQDYNYNAYRSITPRYAGSETVSAKYNTYTDGDYSFGKTAAIDKIKYQYAYLVDIYTASAFLPGRSNAQLKYLIDNGQNVLDLTKANKNLFEVQNVFKSGETTNISLFDYDENNPYTQKLANNPDLAIYEGGWRYLPILHNVSRSASTQSFQFTNFPTVTISAGSTTDPSSPFLNVSNYSLVFYRNTTCDFSGETYQTDAYSVKVISNIGAPSFNVTITLTVSFVDSGGGCGSPTTTTRTISSGTTESSTLSLGSVGPYISEGCSSGLVEITEAEYPCSVSITGASGTSGGGGGTGTSTLTYYTSFFTGSTACIYFLSQSNEIVFNGAISYWYNSGFAPLTFSSSTDIDWATSTLPPVVLPFQPSIGDKVSLFDSASRLGWTEKSEYTIKSVRTSGSVSSLTSSVLLVELSEPVNLALFTSGSGTPTESFTKTPYRSCRYIVWKHVPDETNVILSYNPTSPTLVENGLLFPQYIDTQVRDNAGNVIKALKQQNLI